jgi:hypothetical protein
MTSCLTAACALGDLFRAAGPGDVSFRWTGDTVIAVGVASFFHVDLLVDGAEVDQPAVLVTIPNPQRFDFAATQDSLIGLQPGTGDLVATIVSSLGGRLDSTFRIRVRP